MTEFRRDPILGQWAIVHKTNSWKPEDYKEEKHEFTQEQTCQFCPGKEHQTPEEVDSVRKEGSHPNDSNWQVRVVPNKFPALKIEGETDPWQEGVFEMLNGVGAHEVVIETPEHKKNFADFTPEEFLNVLQKYQSRTVDLEKDKRFKYVTIFRNYGNSAGATVEHAHSQIIALPMVPRYVQGELDGAQNYYNEYQTCVFCDMIEQEADEKERIVVENDDFISFCPFVSRYSFETWIVPKDHKMMFTQLTEDRLKSLTEVFKSTLSKIKSCLNDPSYNFFLHIFPVNYERQESFHWHIEIVPKLTKLSGFEWGTGFYVVHTDPKDAAKYLREAS
jgi:UDPglucose--hexose-1-phosphate uridylyltransferase